ncbi:hypothetical protein [Nocardia aurantiaca]|uniref:Uncharacterized protein n=1 Tax=Nocardia aurantiaca TaxID=2675850 RepID=A0A6I3L7V6_9NOCA|nr:hypothetical protein [Nocardia aurantiaca]MTE17488.1 hypothetical protein [Nocardia aurantiaca]
MSSNSQWSVQAIIASIEREKRRTEEAELVTEEIPVVGYSVRGLWACYSDPGELTAAQAHTAMQLHLECGVDTCWVRWRARAALVAARRMILDPRADRTPSRASRSLFTLWRAVVLACGAVLVGGRHALR